MAALRPMCDWLSTASAAPHPKESLVAIFDNVVIPKLKNMAKSMAGFSKNPAILFAMFCRGSISTWRHVVVSPSYLIEKLAFFYEKVHHPPYE